MPGTEQDIALFPALGCLGAQMPPGAPPEPPEPLQIPIFTSFVEPLWSDVCDFPTP